MWISVSFVEASKIITGLYVLIKFFAPFKTSNSWPSTSIFINETLFEYNFKRVDFVVEPGEFSVRGGIIDVFSFSNDEPYRIEFFGNEVDSIRSFDVETQLSKEKLKKAFDNLNDIQLYLNS